MHIRILFFAFSFIFLTNTFGQIPLSLSDLDKKSRKQYEKALRCIKKKDSKKGVAMIESLVEKYPTFNEGRAKLASYYLSKNRSDEALIQLEAITQSSQAIDPKIGMTLAEEYEKKNEYGKAFDVISKLKRSEKLTAKQKPIVNKRYLELKFRNEAFNNPVPFNPTALPSTINTAESEYMPAFNADGSVLIYTTRDNANSDKPGSGNVNRKSSQEDLYIATINPDGTFNSGTPISALNTIENEGAHTLSQDGNILIFTACGRRDAIGGCDLYISFKKNDEWSPARNLGPQINTRYWDAHPFLAADNKTLYFSSERPGGEGGRDIWKSKLGENGWSKPENIGDVINTKNNDESPFFHPDNKTLYFRSNGHIGMGDYDLFLARKNKGVFSKVTNLGYPINTSRSEGTLFVELNGAKAYYASDTNNEKYNFDILYFDLPEELKPEKVSYIKVLVIDKETRESLSATIELVDLNDTNVQSEIFTNEKGISLSTVTAGNYSLSINKKGYLFHSENINLKAGSEKSKPFVYEIELQRIKPEVIVKSEPIVLKNIFFQTGSAELLPQSQFEIEKLYKLMSENPETKIKILGHTDNVGEEESNLKLSEARAKSVYNALIAKGINVSRLAFEGKGETQPIADNIDEDGRRKNRRTEFVIIK